MKLLTEIWRRSGGSIATYAEIDRNKLGGAFSERLITREHMNSAVNLLPPQVVGVDQYFSALTFGGPARSNANFCGSSILFADLDEVNPVVLDPRPSLAWETSPDSFQAVWYLDVTIRNYGVWADLNKRMTYHTGADRGGWMGSKLLRVPGSMNFKREYEQDGLMRVPRGAVVLETSMTFRHQLLQETLPLVEPKTRRVSDNHPIPLEPREREWIMRAHWDNLPLRARAMLTKKVNDRSLHIVRTANELINAGISREAAFQLIWVQPWCKWRTDRNDPERLWEEILIAGR